MKLFLLLVSIVLVVSAVSRVPSDHNERSEHSGTLAGIIRSVKRLKSNQLSKIYVPEVITARSCTLENFCKAAKVLSEVRAESLGLREKEWTLPRKLAKYSKDVSCEDPSSFYEIELTELLENIQTCAQKRNYRRT